MKLVYMNAFSHVDRFFGCILRKAQLLMYFLQRGST